MERFICKEFNVKASSSLEALDIAKMRHKDIYYVHVKPVVKEKKYNVQLMKHNPKFKNTYMPPVVFKGNSIYDIVPTVCNKW